MKNLSIQEQKQVVGGYWVLKAYKNKDGSLAHYEEFSSKSAAEAKRNSLISAHGSDWNILDLIQR